MSNANEIKISAFSASLNARHAREVANQADATSLKFLLDCSFTCNIADVAALLTQCNVNENFAQDKRICNKEFDMKAINSIDSILRYAFNDTHFKSNNKLKSNIEEVLRTVINFKNAKRDITMRDIEDCLNAEAKINDDRKSLIYQRSTQFAAFKRHAQMTERALSALNILKAENRVFKINNNALLKKLEKKLVA